MQQRLLLRHTPEDVLATPFGNVAAREELLSFAQYPAELPPYTVWITREEQIHRFVQSIPDLAWELMEYATEPLSIIYTRGKAVIKGEKAPVDRCVRLITQPKLLKLLAAQPAWLSVPLSNLKNEDQSIHWAEEEIDCYDQKYPYSRVKIMRIYEDNSFSFLS